MSLRLERMIAMDAAIRGGSYPSVASFMRRSEISERIVRGDLAFMRERLNARLQYEYRRGDYARPFTSLKIVLNRRALLP